MISDTPAIHLAEQRLEALIDTLRRFRSIILLTEDLILGYPGLLTFRTEQDTPGHISFDVYLMSRRIVVLDLEVHGMGRLSGICTPYVYLLVMLPEDDGDLDLVWETDITRSIDIQESVEQVLAAVTGLTKPRYRPAPGLV